MSTRASPGVSEHDEDDETERGNRRGAEEREWEVVGGDEPATDR
jgi:hypothetical protein